MLPWYLFIVVLLVGSAILYLIVVPILLALPPLIGRWLWKADDWEGIVRRREFADGRQVSIWDFPTWAGRVASRRRAEPIDRRERDGRRSDRVVHSARQIPWLPGGKVIPPLPRIVPRLAVVPDAPRRRLGRLRLRTAA